MCVTFRVDDVLLNYTLEEKWHNQEMSAVHAGFWGQVQIYIYLKPYSPFSTLMFSGQCVILNTCITERSCIDENVGAMIGEIKQCTSLSTVVRYCGTVQ